VRSLDDLKDLEEESDKEDLKHGAARG
jgi:hypothetical protein